MPGLAQTLHRRLPTESAEATQAAPAASQDARSALPLAAEGEYRWGESGEVINLYVENGKLRGYLTRRSERGSAGSAPMTFAFTEAETSGSTLSFATRHIHGDWYSFKGHILRGPASRPSIEGYYLLEGRLSTHLGPAELGDETGSDQPLTKLVNLKLAGRRSR